SVYTPKFSKSGKPTKGIKLAIFNAEANDMDEIVSPNKLPAFFLYPAKPNKSIDDSIYFEGDASDINDFTDFIEEHSYWLSASKRHKKKQEL
ncbi:hypothetical protein RFI_31599, partial [Reticulomyxa filosa]